MPTLWKMDYWSSADPTIESKAKVLDSLPLSRLMTCAVVSGLMQVLLSSKASFSLKGLTLMVTWMDSFSRSFNIQFEFIIELLVLIWLQLILVLSCCYGDICSSML